MLYGYDVNIPSLFIFTLDLKSKNADLADLKLSNGSDEDGDYREYTLNPKFDAGQ